MLDLTAPANGFHYWQDPVVEQLGSSANDFLDMLPGPTHIHLKGKSSARCRAAVTLLHGNEPSGFLAMYELLKRGVRPTVDMHFFIASVDAARQAPGFIYRMLPHHKDLNRCFKLPTGDDGQELGEHELDEQDLLAGELIRLLSTLQPECVLDIHNTSGSGPAFGVTTFMDSRHDALVSLFTLRMIVTDLALGSLMEISETMMPTVTIECGGAQDAESHLIAIDGLEKYMLLEDVLSIDHTDMSLEFFHHPIRLELKEGWDIAYGDHPLLSEGVTLLSEIENHNFGSVDETTQLGFVCGPLENILRADDTSGADRLKEFFQLTESRLYPRKKLRFFMVTTNPEIARKDCLLYFVEDDN